MNKKKVQKRLQKKCPECFGTLEIIVRVKNDNGVTYSASYEECEDCGYCKEIKNKHNRVDKYESGL